jgi:hypothetical protein
MSAGEDQFLKFTGDAATRAKEQRGAADAPQSLPANIRPAVVTAADAGIYTVEIIGSDSTAVDTLTGIPAWGSATFAPDDLVWLVWVGERPIPYIMGAGNGNGTVPNHAHSNANGDGGQTVHGVAY